MLTNVNTTTDVSIQKDASTKLVIFFVFVKMDGLANFAIRVSFSKFSKILEIWRDEILGYRINWSI